MCGECVHFENPPLLSEYVVLDPSFLTQEVMSSLFHPDCAGFLVGGKLPHHQLPVIWPKYEHQAEFLMSLMEKFEVCFELQQQQQQQQQQDQLQPPSFWERTSVITAYLPEVPPAKEFNNSTVWPEECPVKTSQLRCGYKFNIIPKELVSRLLVRLHPKMEAKSLWRTGLYLESSSSPSSSSSSGKTVKVKVLIGARLDVNELEVSVRGAEVSVARLILGIVGEEISEVSKNYAGITLNHDDSKIIGEAGGEGGSSGLLKQWWNLSATGEWENRTKGGADLQLLPFYQSHQPLQSHESELLDKLRLVLWSVGGNLDDVEEAFSVRNSSSVSMFESFGSNLLTKHIMSPSLFLRTTWKQMSEVTESEAMVDEHERHLGKSEWNEDAQLKVSLMVQGTTSEAAWGVAQGGFGVIASEKAKGGLGRGSTSRAR